MENFPEYLLFWCSAVIVYVAYQFVLELIKDIRAKYIVWAWKRNKK